MSDLTRPLNGCLSKYDTSIRSKPQRISSIHDEFLKEAYQINDHIHSLRKYLSSIRRAYLSAAPPPRRAQRTLHTSNLSSSDSPHLTDQEKDSIDANSKSFLRDLAASLTQLASAESLRRETSARILAKKYDKGFFGKWAAGAGAAERSPGQRSEEEKLETLKVVRESVVWFLQQKLEVAGELQRKMMERRLEREIEKGRSVLYKSRGGSVNPLDSSQVGHEAANGHGPEGRSERRQKGASGDQGVGLEMEEQTRREIEQQLSPEQLQLFAKENQDMLKQYEDTLDQVRTAERSMLEISELQTQLAQNLDIQSSNISQLVADSMSTTENVGGGNKQLKRATERASKARMVFIGTCSLCGFLIIWDLIV